MYYVLMTLMKSSTGQESRPVAVLDEAHYDVAEQWANDSDLNDWIPLELNDLSLTGLSESPTTFKPKPPIPIEQKADEATQTLESTNNRLIGIIEKLAEKYKDKDVLKIVRELRAEGKISSKTAAKFEELAVGSRVWFDGDDKIVGTIVELRRNRKDPDESIAAVKWDLDKFGQFDVHIARLQSAQKAMQFAASEKTADARGYWLEHKAHHTQDCPFRKDMWSACGCMEDRLPDGKYGCKDCGSHYQLGTQKKHGHTLECPRVAQRSLFASELLRKQNDSANS